MLTVTSSVRATCPVSYYDQSLEFMGYDLMAARMRVAITSYLNPNSYTQKEYFDDIYNTLFKSVAEMRAPSPGRACFAACIHESGTECCL